MKMTPSATASINSAGMPLFIVSVVPIMLFLVSASRATAQDEDLSVLSGWMKWKLRDMAWAFPSEKSGKCLLAVRNNISRI